MVFKITNSTNSLVNNGDIDTVLSLTHEFLTKLLFKIFTNTALYCAGVFTPLGLVCNALILFVLASPGGNSRTRTHSAAAVPTPIRKVDSSVQLSELETRPEVSRLDRQRGKMVKVTPSTRVYYIAIAYGEFGTMLFKDLWWLWLGIGWPGVLKLNPLGPLNPADMSSPIWLCPLSIYLWYVHETIANNAFVMFQLERVVALYFPFRARVFLMTRQAIKARVAVIVISLLSLVLCGTIFSFSKTIPLGPLSPSGSSLGIIADTDLLPVIGAECGASSSVPVWSNFSIIDYLINYIFPAAMSIGCSLIIAAKIMYRRRSLHTQIAGGQTSSQISASELSV